MTVVASKPSVPNRNPARASYAGLGGRTVRLEAPDELSGTWAGPVYATLSHDPQLRTEALSPFFDDADGLKRPAWQAHLTFLLPGERREDLEPALRGHVDVPFWIPHWRLTPTTEDLTSELQERPLLSVFRFLRFTEYFVATPRSDTKLTKHTSDVFLCGQVLAYQPATSIALVDDIDLLQEPGCSYICMVAIRAYTGECHQVVAVPLIDVRHHAISRIEFVLGFYHGMPATLTTLPFDTAWRSFCALASDQAAVRTNLAQAFRAPGAVGGATVDLGTKPVAYVTPRGTKTAVVPAAYAWNAVHPPRASMDHEEGTASPDVLTIHRSDEADLPLLTRPDTDLTPGDQFSPPGLSRPHDSPGVQPLATAPVPAFQGPGPAPIQPSPGQPVAGLSGDALLQALLLEQRATNNVLQSQVSVLSASVTTIQAAGRSLARPRATTSVHSSGPP